MKTVLLLGYYLSLTGYILGLLISNKVVKQTIDSLWYNFVLKSESNLKAEVLAFADIVIDSIYRKNGKLSILKLFIFAIVLNSMFLLVFFSIDPEFSGFKGIEILLLILILLSVLFLGMMLFEYTSYKITTYFLNKALRNNSLIYIFYDLLILLFILYISPGLIVYLISLYYVDVAVAIAIFTPLFPLAMINELSPNPVEIFVMLTSALSIAIPTISLIATISICYNKRTLQLLTIISEKLALIDGKRLRDRSLILFTLCTGSYGIFFK